MSYKTILFEKENHIAKISLNVPESRNALNSDMRAELVEAIRRIAEDHSVRVVVLTGSGKAFCSGGDLRGMEKLTAISSRVRIKKAQGLIKTIFELEKPVIGAINGPAVGAGISLALACDILIASEKAKFAFSFARIGATPDLGAYYFSASRVGVARAKELMFTGDLIDAREAERIGLINRVVPHEKLEEEVFSLATRLVNGPSQAYAMIKACLLYTSPSPRD